MVSFGHVTQGRRFYRLAAAIYGLVLATTVFFIYFDTLNLEVVKGVYNYYTQPSTASDYSSLLEPSRLKWHAIDHLIAEANTTFNTLLQARSTSLSDAAARYRSRRGRHPPPGFDKWFEYAQNHSAVVVEEFFDRIEHDIRPFWALNATVLATRAATWHHRVRVRNGNTTMEGDVTGRVPWLELWMNLVKEAGEWLPDVDMPVNYMDEPRLLVPFETIAQLVEESDRKRRITPINMTKTAYSGEFSADTNDSEPYDPQWFHAPAQYWDYTRQACPPGSATRNSSAITDFSGPLPFPAEPWQPPYSQEGYVRNFTAASDPCQQPHLRGLHGTFIHPVSMSTATELVPLFGGSKLPTNNEILIPAAMYLPTDEFYYGGNDHGPAWANKSGGVVWRGVASGGRATPEKWRGFQRHRLVEMLNGTTVAAAEEGTAPPTFDLRPLQAYGFPRGRQGRLGDWLAQEADVGFNNLLCGDDCGHVAPYFREVEPMPMREQYAFKFMPDADGNSFSGRFRGLLLSTSMPLKATVYAEWHDDRLRPWLHFAPMDNTFRDLYGLLDYFTRDKKGDAAARFIAETGQRWAGKVLRREDMLLYTWRVLLEFARVCDAEREVLGFVDDLR
jgi:hypothetical protein